MIFLEDRLKTLKAYRQERSGLADWVVANPREMENLLHYFCQVNDDISYKAAWILEMVCIQKPDLLFPHLDRFLTHLPEMYKDQAIRPSAKIIELLTENYYRKNPHPVKEKLTKAQREQLTEICFDWLITKQKTAAKAYAMQSLFLLGKEFLWIHPELRVILEKDFPHEMPAFKARARHILKKLNAF